jgi:hypothetical protein
MIRRVLIAVCLTGLAVVALGWFTSRVAVSRKPTVMRLQILDAAKPTWWIFGRYWERIGWSWEDVGLLDTTGGWHLSLAGERGTFNVRVAQDLSPQQLAGVLPDSKLALCGFKWRRVVGQTRPPSPSLSATFQHVDSLDVPFWALACLCTVYPVVAVLIPGLRRWRRRRRGFCLACGYDLRGNASAVCPECGTKVDLSAPHLDANGLAGGRRRSSRWRPVLTAQRMRRVVTMTSALCLIASCVIWVVSYYRVSYRADSWAVRAAWGNLIVYVDIDDTHKNPAGSAEEATGWHVTGFTDNSILWWPKPIRRGRNLAVYLPAWLLILVSLWVWTFSTRLFDKFKPVYAKQRLEQPRATTVVQGRSAPV